MTTRSADIDYQDFIEELNRSREPLPTSEKLLDMKEAEDKAKAEAAEAEITPLVAYMRKRRDEKARRNKVGTTIPWDRLSLELLAGFNPVAEFL